MRERKDQATDEHEYADDAERQQDEGGDRVSFVYALILLFAPKADKAEGFL